VALDAERRDDPRAIVEAFKEAEAHELGAFKRLRAANVQVPRGVPFPTRPRPPRFYWVVPGFVVSDCLSQDFDAFTGSNVASRALLGLTSSIFPC